MNGNFWSFQVLDNSVETAGSKIHIELVGSANIVAIIAGLATLKANIQNMILGTVKRSALTTSQVAYTNVPPANQAAQVELKFQVNYEGATTRKKFRVEIPTADTSKLVTNSDNVDLAEAEVAAFITSFEGMARSPDDPAEAVEVTGIKLVGRNR